MGLGRRIKVLYLDHGDNIGGGQKELTSILAELNGYAKVDSVAVVSEKNHELIEDLLHLKIPVYPIRFNLYKSGYIADVNVRSAILRVDLVRLMLSVLRKIRKVILEHRVDVVYANTFKTAVYASILRHIHGTKTIGGVLRTNDYGNHGLLEKIVLRKMDGLIFNSEYTRSTYSEIMKNSRCLETVRYSPVDDPCESLSSPEERLALKRKYAPRGEKIVGYLGRINPRKRVEDFVEMGKLILERGVDVRFMVVGGYSAEQDPGYYPMIRRLAEDLPGKSMVFTGHVKNPMDLLSIFDVLVLPSIKEPMGRVAVEAVYLGVPVVATYPGGVVEVLEGVNSARLVPAKSPGALARAVAALMEYRDAGGRDAEVTPDPKFVQRFSTEAAIETQLQFYQRVLGN